MQFQEGLCFCYVALTAAGQPVKTSSPGDPHELQIRTLKKQKVFGAGTLKTGSTIYFPFGVKSRAIFALQTLLHPNETIGIVW